MSYIDNELEGGLFGLPSLKDMKKGYRDMKKDLKEKTREMAQSARDKTSSISDAVTKKVESAKKMATDARDKVEAKVSDVLVTNIEDVVLPDRMRYEDVNDNCTKVEGKEPEDLKCRIIISSENDQKVKQAIKNRLNDIGNNFDKVVDQAEEMRLAAKQKMDEAGYGKQLHDSSAGFLGSWIGKPGFSRLIEEYIEANKEGNRIVKEAMEALNDEKKKIITLPNIEAGFMSLHAKSDGQGTTISSVKDRKGKIQEYKIVPVVLTKIDASKEKKKTLYYEAKFSTGRREVEKKGDITVEKYCIGGETMADVYANCKYIAQQVADADTEQEPAEEAEEAEEVKEAEEVEEEQVGGRRKRRSSRRKNRYHDNDELCE